MGLIYISGYTDAYGEIDLSGGIQQGFLEKRDEYLTLGSCTSASVLSQATELTSYLDNTVDIFTHSPIALFVSNFVSGSSDSIDSSTIYSGEPLITGS